MNGCVSQTEPGHFLCSKFVFPVSGYLTDRNSDLVIVGMYVVFLLQTKR